jgi:hypothetical protein
MNKIKLLLSIIIILFCSKGIAQGISSLSSGSIGISYTVEPQRKFRNTNGGYQYNAVGFNARIPLFGNRETSPGHFYETSLLADLQTTSSSFGFVNNSRNFLNGSVGMGAVIYNGGKNIYMMNASVGLAADNDVISKSNTLYRFSGSFIVNHQHSNTTLYQYGAVFTYAFGKPLPLPVLGIRTKLSANWTFSTILPVEISFINRINANTGLSFSIRPSGNRFQFDNQANFATASSTVYLQLREFQLGSSLYYKFAKDFTISGEAGLLLGGKMNFTEQDNNKTSVFETGVKPGGLFRVSVRYRFPNKTGMGPGKMQELLNPLGN